MCSTSDFFLNAICLFQGFRAFPYGSMSPVSCIQAKHIFGLTFVSLEVYLKFIQRRYENGDQQKNQHNDEKSQLMLYKNS